MFYFVEKLSQKIYFEEEDFSKISDNKIPLKISY